MFTGYLELGGVPLLNAEATEQYVAHVAPQLALRPVYGGDRIHVANEEEPYRTPALDRAPWVNAYVDASQGFLGLYPIDVEGLDDATLTASVTEYLGSGGAIGAQRDASRSIRVTGMLVGTSPLAVQAGLEWLRAALRDADCDDCASGTLRYFVADPDVCESGVYGPENGRDSITLGDTSLGIYRYRWASDRVDQSMPSRARWDAQWTEGSIFRYGASAMVGTDLLQQSPLIQPLRRNYAPNPAFRADLTGWVHGGGGSAAWAQASDGSGYAHIISPTSTAASLYGSGAYGADAYAVDTGAGLSNIVGTATDTLPAGNVTLSVALRSATASVTTIELRDASGASLTSVAVTPGTGWQRYSLTYALDASAGLRVAITTADACDVDQVLLESAAAAGTYFDGTSVVPGYLVGWQGPADQSTSIWQWSGVAEITRDDSTWRPTIEIVAGTARGLQLSWATRAIIGMQQQLQPYERHCFDVSCTSGVSKLAEYDLGTNGAYMQVEFTLTAGEPAIYTPPTDVDTTPLTNGPYSDPSDDTAADDLSWLADPNSIVISRPPSAPVILNPAIESITSWQRYYVPIPADAVADWAVSIPTVTITSHGDPITQVRVRFHPNPFGYAPQLVDPTAYCSEFIVSYLPALTRLEVDGVLQRATASRGDRLSADADHLLYGSDGGPISWPELSCAIPYLMTVDVPPGGTLDQFELAVQLRRAA